MDVHVYFHDQASEKKLDQILLAVKSIMEKEIQMDADIQAIVDQAKANTDAESAADAALVSLFNKLAAAIAAAQSLSPADRTTLQNTVATMKASSDAVAAAIVANTPSQ